MNGEDVLRRSDAAFQDQAQQIPVWREAASFCLPRKIWTLNGTSSTGQRQAYVPDAKLQNAVAVKALDVLASGMCSAFMNPAEVWAEWEPSDDLPERNKTDRLRGWYKNASMVAMRVFGPSGLYSRVYETLLDAGGTGTGALMVEKQVPNSDSPINFQTFDVGSYAIAENCIGIVDHLWRRMPYTAAQAEREWPHFKPRTWANLKLEQKLTREEQYTLEILPRDRKEVGQTPGPKGMEYQVTIVHDETKTVVSEGGVEEFPVKVYRFKRQSGSNPWGIGPGVEALPDARGVNWLDTQMADGIGKAVDPPIAVKDDMRGILDLRMGGRVSGKQYEGHAKADL